MTTIVAGGPPHVQREARLRPIFAGVAVAAAVLLLAAAIIQTVGPHTKVDEATLDLIYAHKRAGLDLISAVVNTFGSIAIAATLVFLIDAARARNPQVAPFIRVVAVVGALLASVTSLIYAVLLAQKAHTFVTTGSQTYQEAHQLTTSGGLIAVQLLGLLGALLVAMSLVLVSLQAMRVGLLTRFMGYLGMFAGALVLFQITPLPVVETYWFLALAVLFAGRWPTGEPPAWSTGQAEKWPSGQSMREQRIRAASGAPAGRGADKVPAPAAGRAGKAQAGRTPRGTTEQPAAATGTAGPRQSAKRKRKRKR